MGLLQTCCLRPPPPRSSQGYLSALWLKRRHQSHLLSVTMPFETVWNAHPKDHGKGSRRWCAAAAGGTALSSSTQLDCAGSSRLVQAFAAVAGPANVVPPPSFDTRPTLTCSRVCSNQGGLIRKYGMNICRQVRAVGSNDGYCSGPQDGRIAMVTRI